MRRFVTSVILVLFTLLANAQKEFSVNIFEQLTFDLTASTTPCVDSNGKICALIKAYIPSIKEAVFEGNVVKQEYNQGEYSVYVVPGTSTINVTHPTFGKLAISMSDLGVDLESKTTYRLVLQNNEKNNGIKNGCGDVKIITNPEMSAVLMDGMYIGQTPLLLNNVKTGKHTLTLGRNHDVEISVNEGVLNLYKYKLTSQDKAEAEIFQDENDLYGLKNEEGEIIAEAMYDNMDFECPCSSSYIVLKNGKYGLLNSEGNEIAPCKYDGIFCEAYTGGDMPEPADPSFHIVTLNEKTGFIDKETGNLSIPIMFDGVQGFSYDARYMKANINGNLCVIDRTGEIVVKDYEAISYENQETPIVAIERNGKWGLVDAGKNGASITDFIYDDPDSPEYEEKVKEPFVNENTQLTLITRYINDEEVRVGFADSKDEIIIPAIYNTRSIGVDATDLFHDGLCFLGINDRYAIFDEFGNQLTQFIYLDYLDFYDGIAFAKKNDGKWIRIESSQIRK